MEIDLKAELDLALAMAASLEKTIRVLHDRLTHERRIAAAAQELIRCGYTVNHDA